jgi:hypothetical protein
MKRKKKANGRRRTRQHTDGNWAHLQLALLLAELALQVLNVGGGSEQAELGHDAGQLALGLAQLPPQRRVLFLRLLHQPVPLLAPGVSHESKTHPLRTFRRGNQWSQRSTFSHLGEVQSVTRPVEPTVSHLDQPQPPLLQSKQRHLRNSQCKLVN